MNNLVLNVDFIIKLLNLYKIILLFSKSKENSF